jgi:hypothetical protein
MFLTSTTAHCIHIAIDIDDLRTTVRLLSITFICWGIHLTSTIQVLYANNTF